MLHERPPLLLHPRFWMGLALLWAAIFVVWLPQTSIYQPPVFHPDLTNGMEFSEMVDQHSFRLMHADSSLVGLLLFCPIAILLTWKSRRRELIIVMAAVVLLGVYTFVNTASFEEGTIMRPVSSVEFAGRQYHLSIAETWHSDTLQVSSNFADNQLILSECRLNATDCSSVIVTDSMTDAPMITDGRLDISPSGDQLLVYAPGFDFGERLVFTLQEDESLKDSP